MPNKHAGRNNAVLGMFSEKAKEYGLTFDEFMAAIKAEDIRVVRDGGSDYHFDPPPAHFKLVESA